MCRRTATALLLLALVIPAIVFGGFLYLALIGFFIVASSSEYVQLFRSMKWEPSLVLTVGGSSLILVARSFWPGASDAVFSVLILLAMTFHLIAYERGRDEAALDFCITVGGLVYLGCIASYIIDLRALPNSGWRVMFVFPIIWLTDSGAYAFGAKYGKHKMSPRLSPGKSWEGYLAGVVMGTVYGAFFAFAYTKFGPLHLSIGQGLVFGFLLSTTSILGDFGESLLKRFANAKDSGNLFPGHGGALDRIDSLIWAAVLGEFWIRAFLL